MEKYFQVSTFF